MMGMAQRASKEIGGAVPPAPRVQGAAGGRVEAGARRVDSPGPATSAARTGESYPNECGAVAGPDVR